MRRALLLPLALVLLRAAAGCGGGGDVEQVTGAVLCGDVPDSDRAGVVFPSKYVQCADYTCPRTDNTPPDMDTGCLVESTVTDGKGVSFELWCANYLEVPDVQAPCRECFGFYRRDAGKRSSLIGKCWFTDGRNHVTVEYDNRVPATESGAPGCFVQSVWQNFQGVADGAYGMDPNFSGTAWLPADGLFDMWMYRHHVSRDATDILVFKSEQVETYSYPPVYEQDGVVR